MHHRIQIRSLAIILIAMTLAVLGFQAWILALSHARALDVISTRAANRAQATADQVRAAFKQVDLLLLDLRAHIDAEAVLRGPEAATAEQAALMRRHLRERMARLPLIVSMQVAGPDGRYVYSSLDPIPPLSIADRAYFQAQSRAGRDELVVSDILVSRATGRWAIFPSRRLTTADGRFAGIVLAAIDTEALGSVLTAVDQQQWLFALYDQTGKLAARRPHRQEQIGTQVDEVIREAAREDRPDCAIRAPALGEKNSWIWDGQQVDGLPLVTVAGFNERLTFEQWHRDLRVHLVVALLLIAGVVSILLLHRRNLRAAEALRLSEDYYRTLFDATPDAIAVIEGNRVIDANTCYLRLFQVPSGHATPPWELAPGVQPDGSASLERGGRLVADALAGSLQRSDWCCQRGDGSRFDADITVTLFRHNGRSLLIAIIRDLTEMHAMQEKLRQGQKLEALGQLAGGVAHDFNNMLAAILGSAEIVAARSTDERTRHYNENIVSAAERASQLTHKLLSFARKGKILSTPVDAHHLLQETVALLERTIDPRIVISLRLRAASATIIGDPAQIQNAIINLCINARDAMPQGGSLTIATDIISLEGPACHLGTFTVDAGDHLRISVSDTGTGISAADIVRIFDPFFTTKEVGKGTGLGLASVYGTMVSHKGAITVESTLGDGATFRLYFPHSAATTCEIKPAQPLPTGSGRILIIDDEDMVRTAIAMQLEDLGYAPIAVGDVEAAEAEFRSRHADLTAVLLDLVMPKASGIDVAIRLRAIDPQVPIILISGFPRNAEIKLLLDEGMVGFLQKPFRQAELARIIAQMRRSGG